MSSQAIGQRFSVRRGGCWQCVPDCRSHLAEALTFSSVAYNGLQVVAVGSAMAHNLLLGVAFHFQH